MTVYTDKWKIPFQIDEEDYESVSRYSWYLDVRSGGYIRTNIRDYFKGVWIRKKGLLLHNFIKGKLVDGKEWDHLDQDKTNCQRENLVAKIRSHNSRNHKIYSSNELGHIGIHIDDRYYNIYKACINPNKETGQILIGRFSSLEEAIEARKAAELKYWGIDKCR